LNGTSFLRISVAGSQRFSPAVLQNDLLVIPCHSEPILCILFDGRSRPRGAFEIPDSFVDFVSSSSLRGIDVRDGSLSSFEFNVPHIHDGSPELAFFLLHFCVLGRGAKSSFLDCLTIPILHRFWRGQLFDEYFLVLMRAQYASILKPAHIDFFRTSATTFCRADRFSEPLVPVFNAMNEPHNWPQLIAKHQEVFYMLDSGDVKAETLAEKLVKIVMSFDPRLVPADIAFYASLQLIALQAKLSQHFPIPQHFRARVIPGLGRRIREFWEVHRMTPAACDAYSAPQEEARPRRLRDVEQRWWKLRNEPAMKKMKIPGLETGITGVVRAYAADKINSGVADEVKKLYRVFLGSDMTGGGNSLFHDLFS
jgi:hypothetical protein